MERFARAGVPVAPGERLDELVGRCTIGQLGGRRGALLCCLVALAPHDDDAVLSILVALRPELAQMARTVARGWWEREAAESEVVAIAWEALSGLGTVRALIAEPRDLIHAIWVKVRWATGYRRLALEVVHLSVAVNMAAPEVDPLERWPGLLAEAVACGVLTPRQVVIVAATRMDGRPLSQVATSLGRSYDAVRKERQRAEAALRVFALARRQAQ
jgi:DNA-directed RNA polymerase specialized sigma24 family protein